MIGEGIRAKRLQTRGERQASRVAGSEPKLEVLTLGGVEYKWLYRHGWGNLRGGAGYYGVSVSVWLEPDRTRELVIDFPFSRFGMRTPPRKALLLEAVLPAIEAALAGGWDPESRGRAYRYEVPETGGSEG